MNLTDLPQFTVTSIERGPADTEARVNGQLSHLRGLHNSRGFLYRANAPSLCGDLEPLPENPGQPTAFVTPDADLAPELAVGQTFPWLDGYWNPDQLAMILAPGDRWIRRVFEPRPAQYFELSGVRGWQPIGGPLPDGARDLGVMPAGWDHEHCEICNHRIGLAGQKEGFEDPDSHWLCAACYSRYAARHDISFALEA